MVLVPGKFGIMRIKSQHNDGDRQAISIYKGMNFGDAVTLLLKDDKIYIGYNEAIHCVSEKAALNLFIMLDTVLVTGEDSGKVVEQMLESAQEFFFQEAA